MKLEAIQRTDGVTQVALIGRLDVSGLHEVDMKFHGATAARSQPAIVDLSGLDYIASLGMGMLISCAQSLKRKGHPMVIVAAHDDVDAALRRAGIDQAIPMVGDLDEALQTIGKA
jgi:anti-sigma B factor antagonist